MATTKRTLTPEEFRELGPRIFDSAGYAIIPNSKFRKQAEADLARWRRSNRSSRKALSSTDKPPGWQT